MNLKPSYETDVYTSNAGYLVIKQMGDYGIEQIVMLSPSQAQAVANEIEVLLPETSAAWGAV